MKDLAWLLLGLRSVPDSTIELVSNSTFITSIADLVESGVATEHAEYVLDTILS